MPGGPAAQNNSPWAGPPSAAGLGDLGAAFTGRAGSSGAGLSALPWLASGPQGVGLLATTRRGDLPLPAQRLAQLQRLAERPAAEPTEQVTLAIGPEGGWTEEEEEQALAAGWLAVSLAEPILRTATAAVAGMAQLTSWRQLSCPAGRKPLF